MLKIGSDEWLAAELENRSIRDTNREKFWKEYSKPATNMTEINIPSQQRLANIQNLYAITGNKLNDAALDEMKAYSLSLLLEFSPGTMGGR